MSVTLETYDEIKVVANIAREVIKEIQATD